MLCASPPLFAGAQNFAASTEKPVGLAKEIPEMMQHFSKKYLHILPGGGLALGTGLLLRTFPPTTAGQSNAERHNILIIWGCEAAALPP